MNLGGSLKFKGALFYYKLFVYKRPFDICDDAHKVRAAAWERCGSTGMLDSAWSNGMGVDGNVPVRIRRCSLYAVKMRGLEGLMDGLDQWGGKVGSSRDILPPVLWRMFGTLPGGNVIP